MKKITLVAFGLALAFFTNAQPEAEGKFAAVAIVPFTPVKNQANSGTCWSFSAISMLESEFLTHNEQLDLSEMFIVRNIYVDKAKNYLLRQGAAQFGSGGLGHDVINAIEKYGAVPESAYSGLLLGAQFHDHTKMDAALKTYLDSLLKQRPIPADWLLKYQSILDEYLGKAPESFTFRERTFTPHTFADEFMKFDENEYVNITSFSHHPFYKAFPLEVPDNYASELYYNVPLEDMINLTKNAVRTGYSVVWDTDISNANFRHKDGLALQLADPKKDVPPKVEDEEMPFDQATRQQLFENLVTQDDHLLHIVGLEQTKSGKHFFLVKNSWGASGEAKGMIHVSEAYFAINTVSLVVPRSAIPSEMLQKLSLQY